MRKKILIAGDSFAADWSVKYSEYPGWPNLLSNDYEIINIAQAGISEYKILKQIQSIKNIKDFDCIIISHTSPYRITTRCHPVHYNDVLHANADLIYTDIEYHANRIFGWFNRSLRSAKSFFIHHFDVEYQETVYELFKNEIIKLTVDVKVLSVTNLHVPDKFKEKNDIELTDIQSVNPGKINHLSKDGNILVYNRIKKHLNMLWPL
jgi:hypothetical protein